MKKSISIITMLLCFLLSGCSLKKVSVNPLYNAEKPEVIELPVQTELFNNKEPAIDSDELESSADDSIPDKSSLPDKSVSENVLAPNDIYVPPDYGSHDFPNNDMYTTMLAEDLTDLKNGEQVITYLEEAADLEETFNSIEDLEAYRGGLEPKADGYRYDLRDFDLTDDNLSVIDNWNDASFSTRTVWPEVLPEGFDPVQILEIGKNPGLGIRALHEEGVTGKGVGIAILDGPLLVGHEQIVDNVMLYEKIHSFGDSASMHSSYMASIAAGKDIGVAPDASIYYIASTFGHWIGNKTFYYDASIMADCVLRVLEINKHLPEEEKIRVISISSRYYGDSPGFREMTDAIKNAEDENVLVVTASTSAYFDFVLYPMGRDYLSDPDDFNSYYPWKVIAEDFYKRPETFGNRILVPGAARTYAGYQSDQDYEISSWGGVSPAVAWLSGFYALCCQVKPEITPREFIDLIKGTAVTIEKNHEGMDYSFGQIVNPAAVIAELRK